jgi:enoyl-CoA hydratase/carnithine racemase
MGITLCSQFIGGPQALNSLDLSSAADIRNWLSVWKENSAVTGVILRGTGTFFAGGADLDWLASNRSRAPELFDALGDLYETIRESSTGKPIISLVNGDVSGSGLGLTCARYCVVTDSARFSVPEPSLGLVPDGPALKILAVSEAKSELKGVAAYLSLSGTAVCSDDMMRLGLASHQIADKASAEQLVRQLAALSPADMISGCSTLEQALALNCDWHTKDELDATARSVILDQVGDEACEVEETSGLWNEKHSEVVSGCFGFNKSVEESWELLEALAPQNEFAHDALASMQASPALSLVATLRLAKECSELSTPAASALAQRVATRLSAAQPFGQVIEHSMQGTEAPLTSRQDISAVPDGVVSALFEP